MLIVKVAIIIYSELLNNAIIIEFVIAPDVKVTDEWRAGNHLAEKGPYLIYKFLRDLAGVIEEIRTTK
jgi:hypothetical protein